MGLTSETNSKAGLSGVTDRLVDHLEGSEETDSGQAYPQDTAAGDEIKQVVMFPDFTDGNPYQSELADVLEEAGMSVEVSDYGIFFSVIGEVRRRQLDVVHLHWVEDNFVCQSSVLTVIAGICFILELLLLRALGVRVVWTAHNLSEHNSPSPKAEWMIRAVLTRVVHAIIVHCEESKMAVIDSFLLERRAHQRVVIVPHGHYIDSYENEISRDEARNQLGYTDQMVFLFFGRIRAYKNVPKVVESFKRLAAPEARLLVVGNPFSEELEDEVQCRAAEDERIRTRLEYIPQEEVQLYLNAADALVINHSGPYIAGTAVLGMSFGRPMVSPDAGCLGELLSPAGNVQYSPDGEEGLTEALRRAMQTDLEVSGENNEERAAQFDWQSIAHRTTAIYRGVQREEISAVELSYST